ncbi:MAG TPA: hypothetical protein VMW17_14105 [Candidatus Binatia bacterium]|nr:hypothetical protein [Candidatus Binatia bacterium]
MRALVLLIVLASLARVAHAAGPTLTAVPHQQRTRAADAGIVPLWDTRWWITLRATRGDAALVRIEYSARFQESTDPRSLAGGFDVGAADRDAVSGRIVVTCPVRPDYEKKLRIKLRVSDTSGTASEWTELDFPVRNDPYDPVIKAIPVSIAPQADRRSEVRGTVEVVADDRMRISEVKDALKHKAREQGGDAVVNFRTVSGSDDSVTFAADVVHYVEIAPPPEAAPTPLPVPSDRVLGEIAMPAARR